MPLTDNAPSWFSPHTSTSTRVEYGLQTTEEHDNGAGAVHGGVLATFLDQALSTIAWEAAGRRAASTVSLDLHFACAVRPGQFVHAQDRVVRAGSSLIFLTGVLTAEGREVTIAAGVWRVAALAVAPAVT